jgi:hypothetical protein
MEKIIKKAPVIGFVRYSLNVKYGNKTEAKDVFEEEYFEYRFNIFCNVTLKSFQQQTNNNFVLLLLHSENMPSRYKDRFIELEKNNTFLYNVFVKDTPESFDDALTQSIEYVSFEKDVAITFRIDNDDAVHNDFIQRLNGFLKDEYVGFAISMPSLCIVKRISDTSYMIEERDFPSNSIGLANITNRGEYKTVMQLGDHTKINKKTPMILTSGLAAKHLQTINGENEANGICEINVKILNKEDLNKYLFDEKFGNLDLDCLRIIKISNSSKLSLKKTVKLFIPPLFIRALKKIKNCH